jgi:hypothetical protein
MVMNKIGEGRHMLQMSTQGAKCEKNERKAYYPQKELKM